MHLGLNRLLKRLGMGDRQRNPHALRHGVATLLVSRGVPLGDVARFLGHTVAQVVRVYVHAAGTNPADTLNDVLRA
jgi:integrase